IPPCLLPDRLECFDGLCGPPVKYPDTMYRPEACCGCRLERRCGGFWKTYFDRFGTSELRPLR
ncbi:MAG: hypothetical protein D6806_09390, partial [Deltaproteobacteria bacterium]